MDFDSDFNELVFKMKVNKTLHSTISSVSPLSTNETYPEQATQISSFFDSIGKPSEIAEDQRISKFSTPSGSKDSSRIFQFTNMISIEDESLGLSTLSDRDINSPRTPINNSSPHYDRTYRLINQKFRHI